MNINEDDRWKCDLDILFNPRSVALIGASETSYNGQTFYNNLKAVGYSGKIFPVNPKRKELFGLKCYPRVGDIPGPVDSFIITIPADSVPRVVQECLEKNIKAGIINSSGFGEASAEGKRWEEEIAEIAQKGRIRLVGPNTFGVANIFDKVATISGPDVRYLPPGRIGLIIQSGGLLNFMQLAAWDRGWGISYLVSCGNQAVLRIEDYLEYLVNDDRTEIIGILVEEIKDLKRFAHVADIACGLKKPIIVLKMGKSEKGRIAALAHTGSNVGSDAEYNALFREKGIIRVQDLDDFVETIELFSKRKEIRSVRMGLLLPSGAECGYVSDIASDEGMDLPDPSREAVRRISKVQPPRLSIANPLNVPENYIRNADVFKECLYSFLEDENFDLIGIRLQLPRFRESKDVVARFLDVVEASRKTEKFIFFISRGSVSLPEFWRHLIREHNIPFLFEYRKGFRALGALVAYNLFMEKRRKMST